MIYSAWNVWQVAHRSHPFQGSGWFQYVRKLNLAPPNAAYMRQWIRSALVQTIVCRLFGAKPLPEPMLGCCQLEPKYKTFHSRHCIWKYRLRKGGHFVQGEMSSCRSAARCGQDLGGHFEYSHFIEITVGHYWACNLIKCFAHFPGICRIGKISRSVIYCVYNIKAWIISQEAP